MDFGKKETEQFKEVIFGSVLFRGMDRERAVRVLRLLNGSIKNYKKSEIVVSEEQVLKEAGILLFGTLCKVQVYADGTEQMVQKMKTSYMVGLEIAASAKKTSPCHIYASEDAKVYWFPIRCVEQAGTLPDEDRIFLYQQIVHFLANEDIKKYKKIEVLSTKGARERIRKYLQIQAKRYRSAEFDIEFDREQLANYLGLNRSVLSHELKKMEKEGILKVRKNHFCLYGSSGHGCMFIWPPDQG